MIRAAALLYEAVLAGLEYMKFDRHPRFSPRPKEVNRPLISDRLVVCRYRDEQRRASVRRWIRIRARGINRDREVRPPIGGPVHGRENHSAAGRIANDADPIGPHAKFG